MTNFEEVRNIIGKDIEIKLKKLKEEGYGTLTFKWEWTLGIYRRAFKIADEYRTNELSKIKGRYTIIYSQNEQDRIYPNVHDYMNYIITFLGDAYKFDFIYAWDEEEKKLIIVWEYDRENEIYRMNKQIADLISKHINGDVSQYPNVTVV